MLPELSELKERRRAAGLTQASLALLAGVSQASISKIEKGAADPSYSTARKLFASLEFSGGGKAGRLADVMNRRLVFVDVRDNVGKAVRLMRDRGISQLPVFRDGVPVGSFSEKAVLEGLGKGRTLEDISRESAGNLMLPPFPTMPESAGLDSAAQLLEKFPAILALSARGEVSGIVSRADLLKGTKGLR